ncbi:hypothetical protein CL629_03735 [bacterium]|nr:hypothetical protein [bacterium]|tara:strand:+ start:10423 stop:11295 length:873 start_codon:yes stop_codon:yes gene_type:complete
MREDKGKIEKEMIRDLRRVRPEVQCDENFKNELRNLLEEKAGQMKAQRVMKEDRPLGILTSINRFALGVGGAVFAFIVVAGVVYYQTRIEKPKSDEELLNKIVSLEDDITVESFSFGDSAPKAVPAEAPKQILGIGGGGRESAMPEMMGAAALPMSEIDCKGFTFEGMPADEVYTGQISEVDFSSNEDALVFQTKIIEGTKEGVNFAGYYAVSEWGCGAGCQSHAIVDVRSGEIVFYGLGSQYGVEHYPESYLLIANPYIPEELPSPVTTTYYTLEDGMFQEICPLSHLE